MASTTFLVRGLHEAVHACTLSANTGYAILFEAPWGTERPSSHAR